jgi:hypothetical protein
MSGYRGDEISDQEWNEAERVYWEEQDRLAEMDEEEPTP